MAAVLGLPLQPDDEVLADLPEHEKASDPLHHAKILKTCSIPGGGFREFVGEVVEIEVGSLTGDRLYRIRYSDGDLQHFTAEEVRACIPPEGRQERATPAEVLASGALQATAPPAAVAACPPAEAPGVEEEPDLVLPVEDQDVAPVLAECELEEAGLAALEQEVSLTEEQEASEAVMAEGEQEAEALQEVLEATAVAAPGEAEVAEEAAVLEELATGGEEDLNLIVLEEDEDEAEDDLLEEVTAPLEKQEGDLDETDLIQGYLGGDGYAEELEEPEAEAPVASARAALGVQRDITKAKGRAKCKAQPKVRGRPVISEEVEMEAFDEEAT